MMQKVFLKSYYHEYHKFLYQVQLYAPKIFINDLFFFINKAKLANFADDNTIYVNSAEMETLATRYLRKQSESAIKWFK